MFVLLVLFLFLPLFFSITFLSLSEGGIIHTPHTLLELPSARPEEERAKTNIEQAIVTICETLKALRNMNNCYTGDISELLGFLRQGSVYSGDLQSLSLLPQSATFSCSNADAYGRYLLFRSLSSFEVQNFGYDINPSVVGSDPCGIADFVYRRG